MKDNDRNRAIIAEVIARVWREPAYRDQLKKNAKQVLQQAGMTIPANMEVVVLENTPTVVNAVLPPKADMQRFAPRIQKAVQLLSDMPDNLEVRVRRDSATRSFLVIPALPAQIKPGELSDAQLEQVAGGKGGGKPVTGVAAVQTAIGVTTAVAAAEAVTVTAAAQDAVAVTTAAGVAEVAAAVAAVVAPCFIS